MYWDFLSKFLRGRPKQPRAATLFPKVVVTRCPTDLRSGGEEMLVPVATRTFSRGRSEEEP
jgi:hypothetical protein